MPFPNVTSDYPNSDSVWHDFQTHKQNDFLVPLQRDTGGKPDRMRRQIFRAEQQNMYYIYQQDNTQDSTYPDVYSQAQIEYNCYRYASVFGFNLPDKVAVGFYHDSQTHTAHMILANQAIQEGTPLHHVLAQYSGDAAERDALVAQAAYSATRVTMGYGDNDRKPKNMLVSYPFTPECTFHHVDFEYAMRDPFARLLDNWFRHDVFCEFGPHVQLNRMDMFMMSQDLMSRAETLPDSTFKKKIVQNLDQSLSVIRTHSDLSGPSL